MLVSVRNSLLAIGIFGTALLSWLTVNFWLSAKAEQDDARHILEATLIEDSLLTSAYDWATERSLTYAAINLPGPVQPWNRQAIEHHRKAAEDSLRIALLKYKSLHEDAVEIPTLTEALSFLEAYETLQVRVDKELELPRDQRNPEVAAAIFPAITDLIMAFQRFRLASQFAPRTADPRSEALENLKHNVSVMSEFALRESGLIAGTIAADDPLVLEDVEQLSNYRGSLEEAWTRLLAYQNSPSASKRIIVEIERVRDGYFEAFEKIRAPIIAAGTEGEIYPVSATELIHQTDSAIEPILRLSQVASATSERLTQFREERGQWRLIAATAILAATIIIGVVSMWIVLVWIVGPLERITKAMTELAAGNEAVTVPSTTQRGEIGAMARAVQIFKESQDERARLITDANARLQGLNEDLEHHVEERTSELAAARDEAIDANRSKSQFLANMSHELRTPLNAIIGFSEILVDRTKTEGPENYKDPLKRILSAGQHLLQLINDVLDIAKIEAGKMELVLEAVPPRHAISEAMTTVRPLIEKNNNTFEVVVPETILPVTADSFRLRQILLNLLSNAAKFTENGTIIVEAQAIEQDDQTRIHISVKDSGIGMTPEQAENVFMEFVQADASSTRKYGGTGLGLAISQRFCRMMGGEITVETAPNEGSRFTIDLPASSGNEIATQPKARPTVTATAPKPESKADVEATPNEARERPLVLAIDDDPSVQELLGLVLRADGYDLSVASTGVEGLKLARELNPQLITLDVMLPDIDGWGILASLKNNPETAEIPVVMLSIVDEATRGYALGASEYLTKPIDRLRLLRVLRNYISQVEEARILLVEDDPDTRELIRTTLSELSVQLSEAVNGKDALTRLADGPPDVILLDLMMPEMDGFEFLEALRANQYWHSIPVIVVTAKDLTQEDHERLNGAVTEVLKKSPVVGRELLDHIRKLVKEHARQPTPTTAAVNAQKTLLYVEDNDDNVVLLKTHMEKQGFNVLIATDGAEGVQTAKREKPSLILMDMSLPVLDGWDATRQLKADSATREIPIIGVSAHAMAGDREKALDSGCDDYATKPIDVDDLLQKIDRLLKSTGPVA